MKSSIILIGNPVARKASDKKIAAASYYLQSKGYAVEVCFTEKKGDAEHLAAEAAVKSPSLIVAAGGDGTFNEVANGLAGSEVPLAILPLGTTNVLAKELDIPEDIEDALKIAVTGIPKTVSLGRIKCTHHLSSVYRYFILMAGVGFDGESVYRLSEKVKHFSGKGAYIFSGMKTLAEYSPDSLTFHINDKTYEGYSAIVGKSSKYGGNFRITPDAKISDPSFYVCIFKGAKRLDLLRYLYGIFTGTHLRFQDVTYLRASRIRIQGSAHVQIDGDYIGMTPAEIDIAEDSLRLVY